jgi:hypothetical protein
MRLRHLAAVTVEKAEADGRKARERKAPQSHNPFVKWRSVTDSTLHEAWLRGWRAARAEALAAKKA